MITLSELAVGQASTKAAAVRQMLTRAQGATIADISAETGWQQHSIRAFLSGLRKRGVIMERATHKDGAPYYRLAKPGVSQ